MKTALKIIVGLVLLLLLLPLVGAAVGARYARGQLTKAQDSELARWTAAQARVRTDVARWKDDPLLQSRDGGDAAPVLFAHIRWESTRTSPPPVPDTLKEQMVGRDGGWPEHPEQYDVKDIDTAWMSGLVSAGYFDLEGPSSLLESAPFAPLTGDMPYFVDVQSLAKVRLTQGLQSGDARPAAREVRELARLCFTTETLLGSMIGIALLSIERRVREEAERQGHDVSGWTVLSKEEQDSLRRVLWVSAAPYSLLATGSLAASPPGVGQCTGLAEAIAGAHFLRQYAEAELPDRYSALTRALDEGPCRLRRARAAWKANVSTGQLPLSGAAFCEAGMGQPAKDCHPPPDWTLHFPFVRTIIGDILLTIATPNWLKQYDRAP